jgi:hypothetical protein
MTPTAYCVIAWSVLLVFLLGCLVNGRRDRDRGIEGTGSNAGQSVHYWETEVDSWLAQLAEIRNLVTLTEGDDRPEDQPRRGDQASARVTAGFVSKGGQHVGHGAGERAIRST